ncbi:MAG: acyl-CoA dehydrogenase family protein [Oscillospiraceae bacterium]|jgi:alkylation response protein AidB-like acyl-CoA dehydrogenase|nr:acyl-CoA dehydrogenase family protein [Oscillospiraceae bacterium]
MVFSEKHELIRKLARDFAETELTKEILDTIEETAEYPTELLAKMGKAGFFGIKTPREYGGQGSDYISYVIVLEELGRVSAVTDIWVSAPNSLGGGPLMLSGTPEQLEKYLKPVATGEKIMAFALTEPDAGSDAGGTKTTAVKDGDYYVLNGRKTFITTAPVADWAIVYARTDLSQTKSSRGISAFIVDMKLEGVSCGKAEHKMGIIGCPTSDIILEDVRVHKDDMLGEENRGFQNAMKTLDIGRIGVAAMSIGVAQGALDEAVKYAKERKQFGQRIADFQAIGFMIADMATKLQAAKELVYRAAQLKDANSSDAGVAASMAKLYATEICNEIAGKAVQIHGGYGYIKEYKVERIYRDCRVFTIFEGTSQVQQLVISNALLKK